jgi:hypothetical protein
LPGVRGTETETGRGDTPVSGEAEVKLSHQDLDDLQMAVGCWLNEYTGASPEDEMERMSQLLIRLRVRKMTTKDGD